MRRCFKEKNAIIAKPLNVQVHSENTIQETVDQALSIMNIRQ